MTSAVATCLSFPLTLECAGSHGSNVLIGGLFLHQRRRAAPTKEQLAADCSGRFAGLEFRCQYASALEVGAEIDDWCVFFMSTDSIWMGTAWRIAVNRRRLLL